MIFALSDIPRLFPELLLLLVALMVLANDMLVRWRDDEQTLRERARGAGEFTIIGLVLVLVITLIQSRFLFTMPELGSNAGLNFFIGLGRNIQLAGANAEPLMRAYAIDDLLMVARLLFTICALVVSILALNGPTPKHPAEFFSVLLFATLGLTVMAGAVELMLAYIALELSAISLYVLVGYSREKPQNAEAGLKYFVFGALSSAVMLYGMSLAYGFAASEASRTGANVITTLFAQVGQTGVASLAQSPLLLLAITFIVAGLGYKIAAVPFHSWAPDVYQGAPPVVTMLIATASKTAGFLLIYRLLTVAFPVSFEGLEGSRFGGWAALVAIMALITVVVGNLAALPQTSARRMLAYSGIGHSGFLLLALTLAGGQRLEDRTLATSALLLYLVAYVVTSLTAFGVLSIVVQRLGDDRFDDLRGLWRRNGPLAFLLSLSLLSLAGMPPLAGFWAKLLVFMAAYRAGAVWLVAVALAMTVVGLFYYLRLVRLLWSEPAQPVEPLPIEPSQVWTLGITGALIVLLGLVPAPLWAIFAQVTQ